MPRLIVLSGSSGSGKTSIARALQPLLTAPDRPVLHVETDRLLPHLPSDMSGHFDPRLSEALCEATLAFVISGFDVIADGLLPYDQPQALADALRRLRRVPMTLVGVRCAPDVLAARTVGRHARTEGFGERQEANIHDDMAYDIEVDSSRESPAALAHEIARRLNWDEPAV